MFDVTHQRSEEAVFQLVSVLKREIPEFVTTKRLSFISQLLQNTWMIEWKGYTSVFSCFPAICGTHGLLQYGPVCCNSNGKKKNLLNLCKWKCKFSYFGNYLLNIALTNLKEHHTYLYFWYSLLLIREYILSIQASLLNYAYFLECLF